MIASYYYLKLEEKGKENTDGKTRWKKIRKLNCCFLFRLHPCIFQETITSQKSHSFLKTVSENVKIWRG